MWCIESCVIWGPIENVFGFPGWAGIRKKALCPKWWLGGLRQWWRQPLPMAIMCTAICCLCTGEWSGPGTTAQWGREEESVTSASVWLQQPRQHESHKAILSTQLSLFWKCSRILIIQWRSHSGNNAPHLVTGCNIDINTCGRRPFFMQISQPSLRLRRW